MAVNREELIEYLNDLLETCRDGENGFQTAAEHVKDPELKKFFSQSSDQRAQFASELQSEVRQLGGIPAKTGSVSAAFHRGWMNIKSIVMGGSDDAIVAECERGEDAAVEELPAGAETESSAERATGCEASIHGDQAIPRPHPGSGTSGMTVKQKEHSL